MTGLPVPGTIELAAHYVRDFSFEHPNAPHGLAHAKDASPSADIQAPVVFVGYGTPADYADIDVAGSIVGGGLTTGFWGKLVG